MFEEETYSDLTTLRDDPARGRACAQPHRALILGGASCVWDDILALEQLYGQPWDGLVFAANDIGVHWPRALDHWVSLHSERFRDWVPQRAAHGFSNGYALWGRRPTEPPPLDYIIRPWAGGSSGMFAVQAALEMGCTRVVLCGVPMTQTPHFKETKENFHVFWIAANAHWKAWLQCRDRFGDHVRSMGGRTQELLGGPDLRWLGEGLIS